MVLIVLLGLNGQNNEEQSLFDNGSTIGEKNAGQTPNKEFPNKRWSGKYESFD